MDETINHSVELVNFDHNLNVCNESFLQGGIPIYQRLETYIVPILFLIIFIVGVLGNGTLIVIFIRHRTMRNVPNTYILSLALADLLVIVTSVPFTSIIYTVENYPWGVLICKVTECAKDISISVSICTLTALSADRYFAIVDPFKKLHCTGVTTQTANVTIVIAVSIWVLSFVTAIPTILSSHIMNITMNAENTTFLIVCYPFQKEWLNNNYSQVMVLSRFIFLYLIPLLIIGVFYVKMATHLIVSTKNVPGEIRGAQRQVLARKKVAHTVLLFVIIFAVCFLPTHVFMLWFYLDPHAEEKYNEYWHATRIIGFCLSYINSCINPIALYWISGTFRKHFNWYLHCIKPRARCDTLESNVGARGTSMSLIGITPNKSANSVSRKNDKSTLTDTTHLNSEFLQRNQQPHYQIHAELSENNGGETSVLLCEQYQMNHQYGFNLSRKLHSVERNQNKKLAD